MVCCILAYNAAIFAKDFQLKIKNCKRSLTYCSRSIKYKVISAAWRRLKFKMIRYEK